MTRMNMDKYKEEQEGRLGGPSLLPGCLPFSLCLFVCLCF
jgi:hypothetical protein